MEKSDGRPLRIRRKSESFSSPGAASKIGAALVTLVAVACCAGVPAFLAFVGALGLGVLIQKHLFFPLMTGALLLGSWGAWRSWKTLRNTLSLSVYLVSAVAIPLGMKVWHPLMYAGMAVLMILTGADLLRSFRKSCL